MKQANCYMDVSKNRGPPKWMVKIMENPQKMDDLGGKHRIFGNTHIYFHPIVSWWFTILMLM